MIVGPNGAGKSTAMKAVFGMLDVRSGHVLLDGEDITALSPQDRVIKGMGFVPQTNNIFTSLTVEENLVLATETGSFDQARLKRIYELFPAIETFWTKQAWSLSGGQKQMLAVARAIIEPRALILIDEPTKGLAPSIVAAMAEAFREIAETTTILLVEQNFHFAKSLGRDMAVIEDGRVVHTGTMADFVADKALQERLLSLSA